jgi:hypothetical protein
MNEYKKILWSLNKNKNEDFDLVLLNKDIIPNNRIYKSKKIFPESAIDVTAAYILDRIDSIRYIIKELDILLKINGTFKIVFTSTKKQRHGLGVRSAMQIMYEFSVSTNGRYVLESKEERKNFTILTYTKKISTLEENDSIKNWSFGIITNGQNNASVKSLVKSIVDQKIPKFEVNISGPNPYNNELPNNVNIVKDIDILPDPRGPISRKKNILINSSKFENLCLLHDRYLLPKNWYMNIKEYGNYFDFLEIPNVNVSESRAPYHQVYNNNISDIFIRFNPFLSNKKSSPNQFLQGGSIIGKKSIIIRNLFLDHLHWGEFEDVHFSKKHYLDGSLIYLDTNNHFITNSIRFKDSVIKTSYLHNLFFLVKGCIRWIWILLIHKYNSYKNDIY